MLILLLLLLLLLKLLILHLTAFAFIEVRRLRGDPLPSPARRSTPGVQSGREAVPRKRPAFTPSPI